MKLCLLGSIIVLFYYHIRVKALTFDQPYLYVNALRFSNVTLPCTVIPDGPNEQYNIYWWGETEQIMNGTEPMPLMVRWSLNRTSEHVWDLVLVNAQTSDSGEYICSNDMYGFDGARVNLTVIDPYASRSTSQLGAANEPSSSTTSMVTSSTVEPTTAPTADDPTLVCSADSQCLNNGTCNSTGQCECSKQYIGERCEQFDYCSTNPCQNNGNCSLTDRMTYQCECPTGEFTNCLLNEEDECLSRPPSGSDRYITCIDKIGNAELICAPGYTNTADGCRDKENPQKYCDNHHCMDEGYCKALCNVDECIGGKANCAFTAEPFDTPAFYNNTDCKSLFGNGYDDPKCNKEATLYDGFDLLLSSLKDCSSFFRTVCTQDFGNGFCNPICNNSDCMFDGHDCLVGEQNITYLPGTVVVELERWSNTNRTFNALTMMMRSRIMGTEEIDFSSKHMKPTISLQIDNSMFTDIQYAGQFLAAMIGKRPEWFPARVTDVYVCEVGMYSQMYADKCSKNCSTCIQDGDICDWKTGICQNGCLPNHYGNKCKPCSSNCDQIGEICDITTGQCLSCVEGRYGDRCDNICDSKCTGQCHQATGECECEPGSYWSDTTYRCESCSFGCEIAICNSTTGACDCLPTYFGFQCADPCNKNCINNECDVTGECTSGCAVGFYGADCGMSCFEGCTSCSRLDGDCTGQCKSGYDGLNCMNKQTGVGPGSSDHTGVIIGLIIGILLIVVIIGVACCYWRRRQSGDFIIDDEDNEDPGKAPNNVLVANESGMQPSSPMLGKSNDMIDMDAGNQTVVYAGPTAVNGPATTVDVQVASTDAQGATGEEVTNNQQQKGDDDPTERPTSGDSSSIPEGAGKRKCSSITIEVDKRGRVLSISDGSEPPHSPVALSGGGTAIGTIEDVEHEPDDVEDDAFVEPPPQSPLTDIKAPLASEENILSSLGPKDADFNVSDEPASIVNENEKDTSDSGSKRPSKGSSSSSSSSSTSNPDEENEQITEM